MRNLSYPETIVVLSMVVVASGLCYATWFVPALEQIHADRQATRALLFALARTEPAPSAKAGALRLDPPKPPIAARPEAEPRAKQERVSRRVLRKRPAPDTALELGESSDPISGLELTP